VSIDRGDIDYVSDPDTAARAYLELKHDLDDPGTTHGRRIEAKAAMNKLERVFPEAGEHAANASDDDLGGLPTHLKRTRDQHRSERGVSAKQAANARRRSRRGPAVAAPKSATGHGAAPGKASARRGPSPRTVRAARRRASSAADYVAPAAVSYSQLAFQVFGWGIGLSLAYLLLSNTERSPRGRSAVELIAKGMGNTVATLVSPLADPLSPTHRPAPAGTIVGGIGGGTFPAHPHLIRPAPAAPPSPGYTGPKPVLGHANAP
jgi:hypothetical protein